MENLNYPRNDTYILIPSYKPDNLLIELLVKLKEAGFDSIVVNDGSGEEYDLIFKQAEEYATVLAHETNRGKGAAVKTRRIRSCSGLHREESLRALIREDSHGICHLPRETDTTTGMNCGCYCLRIITILDRKYIKNDLFNEVTIGKAVHISKVLFHLRTTRK